MSIEHGPLLKIRENLFLKLFDESGVSPLDQVKILEEISFYIEKSILESISISDFVEILIDKKSEDFVSIADKISAIISSNKADNVSINELLKIDVEKNALDGVLVSDEISALINKSNTDQISVQEAIAKAMAVSKSDIILVSESLSFSKEHFTEYLEGVTIAEEVIVLIVSESGLINGSTINGAMI